MKTDDIGSKRPSPVPRDEPITPPIRNDKPPIGADARDERGNPPEPRGAHLQPTKGVGVVPNTDVSARRNTDEPIRPPQRPDEAQAFSVASAKLGVDKASDEPIRRTTTTDLHKPIVKGPASVTAGTRSKRVSQAVAAGLVVSGLLAIGVAVVRAQR